MDGGWTTLTFDSSIRCSADSDSRARLWWERLISRGLEKDVEMGGLKPGRWSASWTDTEPDSALFKDASEYEILFRWSGLERVDKLGIRLPAVTVLAAGSKEYCKLLKGLFSGVQEETE